MCDNLFPWVVKSSFRPIGRNTYGPFSSDDIHMHLGKLKKSKLSQEKRAKWREAALTEYAKSNPKHNWRSLDDEDFVEAPNPPFSRKSSKGL